MQISILYSLTVDSVNFCYCTSMSEAYTAVDGLRCVSESKFEIATLLGVVLHLCNVLTVIKIVYPSF